MSAGGSTIRHQPPAKLAIAMEAAGAKRPENEYESQQMNDQYQTNEIAVYRLMNPSRVSFRKREFQ